MLFEFSCLCALTLILLALVPLLRLKFMTIPQLQFDPDADIIVVGAGVFGCAFSFAMAQFGYKILIIEKDINNDTTKLLGEYLQPGGILALEKLGMRDCIEGFLETRGYILHHKDSDSLVDVNYLQSGKTPINGVTFHYHDFVNSLRRKLSQVENVQIIPGCVTRIVKEKGVVIGVEYENEGETKTLKATLNVIADGSLSKLKTQIHKKIKETRFAYFIGCVLTDCPQTKPDYADIILTDSTPILVYRIDPSNTRLLIDVTSMPANIQRFMQENILPDMPEHMRPSVEDAVQNADVMVMPCRSTANAFPLIPGLIHAGDSFNTRHPLTGGGFSVALYDAILLRNRLRGADLTDYRSVLYRLRTFGLERAMNYSLVVNVMSFALHQVFASTDEITRHLRSACIGYLQKEGECLAGPTSLLAVSVSSPFVFIYHFLSVALHCCYLIMRSHPLTRLDLMARDIYMHLSKACRIVVPLIWNDVSAVLTI